MYSPLSEKQIKKRNGDIKKRLKNIGKMRERKLMMDALMAVEGPLNQ